MHFDRPPLPPTIEKTSQKRCGHLGLGLLGLVHTGVDTRLCRRMVVDQNDKDAFLRLSREAIPKFRNQNAS